MNNLEGNQGSFHACILNSKLIPYSGEQRAEFLGVPGEQPKVSPHKNKFELYIIQQDQLFHPIQSLSLKIWKLRNYV